MRMSFINNIKNSLDEYKLKNIVKRKNIFISFVFSLVLIGHSFSLLPALARGSNGGAYWPTNEWVILEPEEQGIDSKDLSDMYEYIEDQSLDVHSVIIVRNGYIVSEEYLYNSHIRTEKKYGDDYPGPYGNDVIYNRTVHRQWSTTKSIMSLLVGIALEKGYLNGLNQTLYEFYANVWDTSYNDKMNITIEQLLIHNSGLPYGGFKDPIIENILSETLLFSPGTPGAIEYSNDGIDILSAIFNNVTGYNASEFARKNLFEPMGITEEEWYWWGDSNNISSGSGGLMCTPRVQAKIGIICLNNGTWNGTQVVPSNWIKEATSYKCEGSYYYGWPLHLVSFNLGYLFYIGEEGAYNTGGYGGQNIHNIPKYNITVAFTGKDVDLTYLEHIIDNYILKFAAENGPGGLIPSFPLVILVFNILGIMSIYIVILKKKIRKRENNYHNFSK